jgi:hypothetical protein
MLRMLTWGPTGPLGESGGSSVGKDEESDVERRYLQDSSIHLCWIRIDRSAFVSKYWTYWSHTGDISSVNWCILFVNRCLTFSTTSMAVYGRGTEWGLTNLSADVLWIRTGAFFFSGAVTLSNSVESMWKVVMYSLSWACTCRVYHISPIWCTSIQIVVTLRYK